MIEAFVHSTTMLCTVPYLQNAQRSTTALELVLCCRRRRRQSTMRHVHLLRGGRTEGSTLQCFYSTYQAVSHRGRMM